MKMIDLVIKGVCKSCMYKDLKLFETPEGWKVFCRHELICKFIGDPDGEERMKALRMVKGNE